MLARSDHSTYNRLALIVRYPAGNHIGGKVERVANTYIRGGEHSAARPQTSAGRIDCRHSDLDGTPQRRECRERMFIGRCGSGLIHAQAVVAAGAQIDMGRHAGSIAHDDVNTAASRRKPRNATGTAVIERVQTGRVGDSYDEPVAQIPAAVDETERQPAVALGRIAPHDTSVIDTDGVTQILDELVVNPLDTLGAAPEIGRGRIRGHMLSDDIIRPLRAALPAAAYTVGISRLRREVGQRHRIDHKTRHAAVIERTAAIRNGADTMRRTIITPVTRTSAVTQRIDCIAREQCGGQPREDAPRAVDTVCKSYRAEVILDEDHIPLHQQALLVGQHSAQRRGTHRDLDSEPHGRVGRDDIGRARRIDRQHRHAPLGDIDRIDLDRAVAQEHTETVAPRSYAQRAHLARGSQIARLAVEPDDLHGLHFAAADGERKQLRRAVAGGHRTPIYYRIRVEESVILYRVEPQALAPAAVVEGYAPRLREDIP